MIDPRVKRLLEAGVHFGHQTRRWNPKMKPFIFTARNGIYIIDLNKTLRAIDAAKRKIEEVVANGKPILFVGTKKQAKHVLKEAAERIGVFHVTERWLGGMLTNFHTIRGGIKRLKQIEKMKEDGTIEKFTKKEIIGINREQDKLVKVIGGIKEMNTLPGLVFLVDAKKEKIAVAEAAKLNIPIVAVIDTNADPDLIDFPIAGNDDAIKSIKVITNELCDAIYNARHGATVKEMSGEEFVEAPAEIKTEVKTEAEPKAESTPKTEDVPKTEDKAAESNSGDDKTEKQS
ncbi:MAG: 30S ribosomal protein S2 [candidate division Zixibacteria bacterium]|nr:30S ribosomal protein S2 [candidate division Zixibacteria bacterium]